MEFPDNPHLAMAVATGFAFLRDVMWDHEYGGWYISTDRQGKPGEDHAKHAHGMAYAMEACFAVYSATGDHAAFDLGLKAYEYLEKNALDREHGGYFGPMHRDGKRLLPGQGLVRDAIGVPVGLKDMDVNKDMLGALAYAGNVAHTHAAIRQSASVLLENIIACFGSHPAQPPWFLYNPDWSPASRYWKPSEIVQAAGLLIEARKFARSEQECIDTAGSILERAFAFGWCRRGGIVFESNAGRPLTARECENTPWWPQFELLKAAEYMALLKPRQPAIAGILDAARKEVVLYLSKNGGGVNQFPRSRLRLRDRLFHRRRWLEAGIKGEQWKDASHDGRVLLRLTCLEGDPHVAGPPRTSKGR
jgi:mannobiose 2-epimerase